MHYVLVDYVKNKVIIFDENNNRMNAQDTSKKIKCKKITNVCNT